MKNSNAPFLSSDVYSELSIDDLLAKSTKLTEDWLLQFASKPKFTEQLQLIFDSENNFDRFREEWQTHDFYLPTIKIDFSQELNKANAAFSGDTNKIYFSQEFLLANQSNPNAIAAVLLEEYGHYLDSKINSTDAPGDEGAIFSALVRGEELNTSQLQQFKNEDDTSVVILDGEEIAIEQNTQITKLTDSIFWNFSPAISDNNIVWEEYTGDLFEAVLSDDFEIIFYDGQITKQLTGNVEDDTSPAISGNNVVWEQRDLVGNGYEIIFYDGQTTKQLTDNDLDDTSPAISDNNIVWEQFDGTDSEIVFYDGQTTKQLTDNDLDDSLPAISGDNIVWQQSDGNDSEIVFYDGQTTKQLTDNDLDDSLPAISGDNIVWQQSDGNDSEIVFYDGQTTKQLTDNDLDDSLPAISGNNIVWQQSNVWYQSDGTDSEIVFYDGQTTKQLTDNNLDDSSPAISGNNIVWVESYSNASNIILAKIARGSTVYRFFNPTAGVHFYTADRNESDYVRDNLDNYNYEGESYVTVDPLTGNDAEEVYRFFNSTTGVHLYTTDETERDYIIDNLDNFAYEDVKFHAYETEIEGTVPIYRFYEPTIGVHFYTPNEGEKTYVEDNLSNYTYEGIAYYAFPINEI